MTAIRLYGRDAENRLEDLQHEIGLAECGGVCPAPGDAILADWTPDARTVWEVRERYFKAKGHGDYIVLVVNERPAEPFERDLF